MLHPDQLAEAVRYEGGISRRLWLAYTSALAAIPLLSRQNSVQARTSFSSDPFTLGVASGDPDATSVVLWTRLAPSPLEANGGMPAEAVEVIWELSDDAEMKKILKSGKSVAPPALGHSVHVEVDGLEPDRWYWYRFRAGDAISRVGRTRTAPLATSQPEELRFAFASCQHYESGWFTAYDHMAKDELDLVVHLGDYIYEAAGKDNLVRKHAGPKLRTIGDYRVRHAQYRTDAHLQAMHARCPWVVTWDDHEFENNYANGISEKKGVDPVAFLHQRANAYQAYYEGMPLRKSAIPQGPNMKLYRTVNYGTLAAFQVLDTRQYRTDQPNGDRPADINDAAIDPKNTMLGAEQAAWLRAAVKKSPAVWNVLAQQVMMGMVAIAKGPKYSMDQWPGYAHERMKLMADFAANKVSNPVVLTGDIHSNWVNNLRVDDRKAETPVVATEFVGTSISSGGNGSPIIKGLDDLLAANPCIQFHNRQRGYVRCVVTPKQWHADYRIVPVVNQPGSDVNTVASFIVEAGRPGAVKA